MSQVSKLKKPYLFFPRESTLGLDLVVLVFSLIRLHKHDFSLGVITWCLGLDLGRCLQSQTTDTVYFQCLAQYLFKTLYTGERYLHSSCPLWWTSDVRGLCFHFEFIREIHSHKLIGICGYRKIENIENQVMTLLSDLKKKKGLLQQNAIAAICSQS